MSTTDPQPQPEPAPEPVPEPEPEVPAMPALPTVVVVTASFAARMPTQRVIDTIQRAEGGTIGELMDRQPMRIMALRALVRDHPDYDVMALWLHAYDVEVQIETVDPTSPNGTTPALLSVGSTAAGPTT